MANGLLGKHLLCEHSLGYLSNLGQHSWFLFGWTFASWTYFGVFVKLQWSYVQGPKSFTHHVLEISPSLVNIASDRLRAKRAPLLMRKKEKWKWMTVSILHSLWREQTYLLTCRRHNLFSGTPNDTVVSWITLRGMIKVYWLDLNLAYILDHAVCCASGTSLGRSLHLIISQLRMKHSLSNCLNHVRQTKSSVKKRIIVCQTVWSMFGEQTVCPVKNGL